ncbi:MAG TPA: chemotaxis protein [Burkholderiales bacterium]|nr:chemotaxis protein [Burkholderiales bacterium]
MDLSESKSLIDAVDARTKLAGANKMEILLFSLGGGETFGINVFKVREVTKAPAITPSPNMPAGVEGLISLRGSIIPVIELARFVDGAPRAEGVSDTMMVTEYCRHTQGFLVHDVDRIIRVDWDKVRAPDSALAGNDGLITALTELPGGKLVSILDVEQILVKAFGEVVVPDLDPIRTEKDCTVLFVDDSMVARREIAQVLEKLAVKSHVATNGLEGWVKLQSLAAQAQHDGTPLKQRLNLVLVDAEMPEMDGYVLTKQIKADRRFEGIPVVMHSSLSSAANRAMGNRVGVDAYVAKFDPKVLAETLRPLLAR